MRFGYDEWQRFRAAGWTQLLPRLLRFQELQLLLKEPVLDEEYLRHDGRISLCCVFGCSRYSLRSTGQHHSLDTSHTNLALWQQETEPGRTVARRGGEGGLKVTVAIFYPHLRSPLQVYLSFRCNHRSSRALMSKINIAHFLSRTHFRSRSIHSLRLAE